MPKTIPSKIKMKILGVAFLLAIFLIPVIIYAHPGRTDANDCHTCQTNCTEKYGIPYGFYHRHNPIRPCFEENTQTTTESISKPAPQNISIPAPKIEIKTEKATEIIKFETKQQDDPNLSKGEQKVITEGKDGKKEVTFEVTYTDGKETNRKQISEIIIEQPVPKIISIGTKEQTDNGQVAGIQTTNSPKAWEWIVGIIIFLGIPALIVWEIVKLVKKIKRKK